MLNIGNVGLTMGCVDHALNIYKDCKSIFDNHYGKGHIKSADTI